jgi:lipoprotein
MKKYFVVGIALLGLVACTNEQKIMKENYSKIEDQFITEDIYSIPRIPEGIDRPDKEGMYNLTIGEDTFIMKKVHIIDYKNIYAKKRLKNQDYAVFEVVFPSEIITQFDTSNIINDGYIVMLDKDNVIKSIEKINRGIVKSNTKIKKILIAPNFFVEHRLATGDRIQAIK